MSNKNENQGWGALEPKRLELAAKGFRLSRGTLHSSDGDKLPTLQIDRPDTPAWNGVWDAFLTRSQESEILEQLYAVALIKWEEDCVYYAHAS